MNSIEIARLAIQALEDKKAEEIKTIDISEVSVIADYFIIANGTNRSQIQALSDHVGRYSARQAYRCARLRDIRMPTGYFWISMT